jgi:hypothetical protein
MRLDELYRECDSFIEAALAPRGFRCIHQGEYLRSELEGEDRILVDPDEREMRFAVLLSYYPRYMGVIEDLTHLGGEDRGFPCGPYLSPFRIGRREHSWSFKNPETLKKSLVEVVASFERFGMDWLASLRDPRTFAQAVDPVAALYAAYANEVAGQTEVARQLYRETHRRLIAGMSLGLSEVEFLSTAGKEYVFTALKLDLDHERCEEIQRKLNYYPVVNRL